MKNIVSLSDSELTHDLKSLVREERRITLEVLHHLREVERRRLFAERGFPSLFEYCVKELGYSESAAYRRISTMRALKETPEIEAAIETGRLSVTIVSRVQTFLRAEKVRNQKSYDTRELFKSLEGKSTHEVEKALQGISPESATPRERTRQVSADLTEIRLLADEALMNQLRRLRDLYSHRLKDPNSHAELFALMAKQLLAADTGSKETVAVAEVKPAPHSRYVPKSVRREVWKRAKGRCTYLDPVTCRNCDSTFKLQVEHKTPFSLGGSSRDIANLTLLCAAHNHLQAVKMFGSRKMDSFATRGNGPIRA